MTAPPGDRGQLDFLQHVQRIFDEGEFVATYKFALLIALVELAIERGDDTGAPLDLDLHSIAEKFIEQYWPHAAPYSAAEGAPAVLVQNHGRQAAIVARVAEARGRFGSLARAKGDRSWRGFVGSIAQIVKEMPLWKLQTLRRRNVPFLYEKNSGPRITLLPGVAFNLRRFGALIQLLARSSWLEHIRANPRNAPTVGGAMKQDPHVDHFIPWSRYPRDLAARLSPAGFLDDQPAALQVARWAYRQAEATSAQLWVSLKYTVNADGRCREILGA